MICCRRVCPCIGRNLLLCAQHSNPAVGPGYLRYVGEPELHAEFAPSDNRFEANLAMVCDASGQPIGFVEAGYRMPMRRAIAPPLGSE